MSFEVVYTSSANGLRDGDRGFCTVAATAGIPRKLQETLESLSGYRHAFAASSSSNPVNYSHLIVRVRREPIHVLSRIADAGSDYSGRSNKIAHHLALTSDELRGMESGPHALLADPEFWFRKWDRQPQTLPTGRMPRPHRCGVAGCGTWESMFGDPGWAGLLASAQHRDQSNASVILPVGRGNLALVAETLGLLERRAHWQVGFSTYFNRVPAGVQCQWRFVLEGTQEAEAVRANPRGTLIDPIGARKPLRGDDPFVRAARGEQVRHAERGDRSSPPEDVADQRSTRRPITKSQLRRREAGARARRARLAARRPVRRHGQTEIRPEITSAPQSAGRGKRFWGIVIGCSIAAAAGLYLLASTFL